MSINQHNLYDFHIDIAETYDQNENLTQDVELLRNLLGNKGRLNILITFCRTGRMLFPLSIDDHTKYGIDQSRSMVQFAKKKIDQLQNDVQKRIQLKCAEFCNPLNLLEN